MGAYGRGSLRRFIKALISDRLPVIPCTLVSSRMMRSNCGAAICICRSSWPTRVHKFDAPHAATTVWPMMVMMRASGTFLSRCHCRSSASLMGASRNCDAERRETRRAACDHGEELDCGELERRPGGGARGHQRAGRLQCFRNFGELLER